MKLSEILKDWPKNKYVPHYDMHKIMNNIYFNKALESCDYEIDREALGHALLNIIISFQFDESVESADRIRGYKDRIIDSFISTMPTWLKPTERK